MGKGETQGRPETSLGDGQCRGRGEEVYMQKMRMLTVTPKELWEMDPPTHQVSSVLALKTPTCKSKYSHLRSSRILVS